LDELPRPVSSHLEKDKYRPLLSGLASEQSKPGRGAKEGKQERKRSCPDEKVHQGLVAPSQGERVRLYPVV